MSQSVERSDLEVDERLARFIEEEALPGMGATEPLLHACRLRLKGLS